MSYMYELFQGSDFRALNLLNDFMSMPECAYTIVCMPDTYVF